MTQSTKFDLFLDFKQLEDERDEEEEEIFAVLAIS